MGGHLLGESDDENGDRGLRGTCILALPLREALAHGGGLNSDGCHRETATGGYHCHRGKRNEGRKDDGSQGDDGGWQRKGACEAARANMQRQADAWNHREAAAWAQVQEACADESPVGQAQCENRSRMYQANYSPAAAAEFQEYLLGRMAEACAPPKSPEEVQCHRIARAIEGARSRRNDKGIAYWTQRSTEAGCT